MRPRRWRRRRRRRPSALGLSWSGRRGDICGAELLDVLDGHTALVQALDQLGGGRCALAVFGAFVQSQPGDLLFFSGELHVVAGAPARARGAGVWMGSTWVIAGATGAGGVAWELDQANQINQQPSPTRILRPSLSNPTPLRVTSPPKGA